MAAIKQAFKYDDDQVLVYQIWNYGPDLLAFEPRFDTNFSIAEDDEFRRKRRIASSYVQRIYDNPPFIPHTKYLRSTNDDLEAMRDGNLGVDGWFEEAYKNGFLYLDQLKEFYENIKNRCTADELRLFDDRIKAHFWDGKLNEPHGGGTNIYKEHRAQVKRLIKNLVSEELPIEVTRFIVHPHISSSAFTRLHEYGIPFFAYILPTKTSHELQEMVFINRTIADTGLMGREDDTADTDYQWEEIEREFFQSLREGYFKPRYPEFYDADDEHRETRIDGNPETFLYYDKPESENDENEQDEPQPQQHGQTPPRREAPYARRQREREQQQQQQQQQQQPQQQQQQPQPQPQQQQQQAGGGGGPPGPNLAPDGAPIDDGTNLPGYSSGANGSLNIRARHLVGMARALPQTDLRFDHFTRFGTTEMRSQSLRRANVRPGDLRINAGPTRLDPLYVITFTRGQRRPIFNPVV
jgi:hypothetical protein